MTPPVDSKGADRELEAITMKLYEAGVNDSMHDKVAEHMHQLPNGVYQGYEPAKQAKQAILALLAQEVKRVIGEDEPLDSEWPPHNEADNSREIYLQTLGQNLLRAEQRRKAGLV